MLGISALSVFCLLAVLVLTTITGYLLRAIVNSTYPRRPRPTNKVQLCAYGNHIGSNLRDLERFLDDPCLTGAISGLHLLPVYPSTGDGGFAPMTYQEINPAMGSWEDVERLCLKFEVMLELMPNHISRASKEFQDLIRNGEASATADMWIDWTQFWQGSPSAEQLGRISLTKPRVPFRTIHSDDGSVKNVWCTFGDEQMDIDVFSASGKQFLMEALTSLCERRPTLIRLDALAFITKKPDTNCFFQEPEVFNFVEDAKKVADKYGVSLLCEVHEDYRHNVALEKHGVYVYDFALPLLVIHAFKYQNAQSLREWIPRCPRHQFTVLDTHDGMGIDDITGLIKENQQMPLVAHCVEDLGCQKMDQYSLRDGHFFHHEHQLNSTYFSALQSDDQAYLLARTIQFFMPGIPMVYYYGLLAAENALPDHVDEDDGGRGVNRRRYTLEEARGRLDEPVVRTLIQLCRFRNQHPAFGGEVEVKPAEEGDFILEITWKKSSWRGGSQFACLRANLKSKHFTVAASAPSARQADENFWLPSGIMEFP